MFGSPVNQAFQNAVKDESNGKGRYGPLLISSETPPRAAHESDWLAEAPLPGTPLAKTRGQTDEERERLHSRSEMRRRKFDALIQRVESEMRFFEKQPRTKRTKKVKKDGSSPAVDPFVVVPFGATTTATSNSKADDSDDSDDSDAMGDVDQDGDDDEVSLKSDAATPTPLTVSKSRVAAKSRHSSSTPVYVVPTATTASKSATLDLSTVDEEPEDASTPTPKTAGSGVDADKDGDGRHDAHIPGPVVAWNAGGLDIKSSNASTHASPAKKILVQTLTDDPSIIPAPTPFRPERLTTRTTRTTRILKTTAFLAFDSGDEDDASDDGSKREGATAIDSEDYYSTSENESEPRRLSYDEGDVEDDQGEPQQSDAEAFKARKKKKKKLTLRRETDDVASDFAQPEYIVSDESTPLQIAAAHGDQATIAALLTDGGHSVDEEDYQGRTALMYAVHCNQLEMTAFLIAMGADINHRSHDGATPLHRAAFCGTKAMVVLLLHHGADNKLTDNEGRIALHWAAHNPNIGCLSALLKKVKHSLVNKPDSQGMTALLWAAYYDRSAHYKKLVRNKADESVSDIDGKRAVHWAVEGDSADCFRQILTMENSLLVDNAGKTPGHYAAQSGNIKAMKAMVRLRAACVNDVDNNSRTPLHYAAVCNHPRVLRYLIKHAAPLDAEDALGMRPIDYAAEKGCAQAHAILSLAHDGKPLTSADEAMVTETAMTDGDISFDDDHLVPSENVQAIFELLARGTYLLKYTNNGKGSCHYRFFWIDMLTGEVCWMKNHDDFKTNPKSVEGRALTSVIAHPSVNVRNRSDYDDKGTHAFAFTINTAGRQLDVIAPSEPIFLLWTHGVRLLFLYRDALLHAMQRKHLPPAADGDEGEGDGGDDDAVAEEEREAGRDE